MKTPEQMVLEFHQKYGHLISPAPTTEISVAVKQLRIQLMQEELSELISKGIEKNNLVEIADGLADLVYVVVGTAISYGIPFDRIFKEVHNSNMTKTAAKVTNALAGKKYGSGNPKGPDFIPADIESIFAGEETLLELVEKTK
jgi:NTP pyrophosphatase (non-canonical NTP hydrolase)